MNKQTETVELFDVCSTSEVDPILDSEASPVAKILYQRLPQQSTAKLRRKENGIQG